MSIYTNEDRFQRQDEARALDLARGERKRSFEREMKGTFAQNTAQNEKMLGTFQQNVLEKRAMEGTFNQKADLRREIEGPFAKRNDAENYRAHLTANTQMRGQDLTSQATIRGQDVNMIDNAAQRSMMQGVYGMQDKTIRMGQETLTMEHRRKTYGDMTLRLNDDAYKAFPDDPAKQADYVKKGLMRLNKLFPEFGQAAPELPGEMRAGAQSSTESKPQIQSPVPSFVNRKNAQLRTTENSDLGMGVPMDTPPNRRPQQQQRTSSTYNDPMTGLTMEGFDSPRMSRRPMQQPEPTMDGLTRRTMQLYDVPQSNATTNAMDVVSQGQRPLRRPIPKYDLGWEPIKERTATR